MLVMTQDKPITDWDELGVVLTVEQAAEVLQLHFTTVKRLLKQGKLPGRKVGRQWRINKTDLMRYMGVSEDQI